MRFFLIISFLTLALSLAGQEFRHVWAKSGLTMRATGAADGEKIGRLNYGSQVELTGKHGENLKVEVFESFEVTNYDTKLISQPWSMHDEYVEVISEGVTGWVYAGYLSHFDPPILTNGAPDLFTWLERIAGGPPSKVVTDDSREGRDFTVWQYGRGITRTEELGEGWGSNTLVIPLATFNEAFLIAETFWNISDYMNKIRNEDNEDSFYILEEAKDYYLQFSEEMSDLSVSQVGGVVIITSSGGC